jgi:hypothetical protein
MSTPSLKPFSPFDLSPYAPKKARTQAAAEHAPENDAETVGRLPLDGGSEPASVDEAWHKAQDDAAQAGAASTPETAEEHPSDHAGDAAETRDPDMERIETSLRWLQREGTSRRLPRAVQLPPIAGLRSVADDARGRDQFINGMRVPHSLAPERLRPPPPMRERRDHLRGALRVLVACLIAAPIAYYFSAGSFTLSSQPQRNPQAEQGSSQAEAPRDTQLASIASRVVTARQFPLPREDVRPGEADDYNSMLASQNRAASQPPPAARNGVAPAIDVPAPAAAPAAEPAPAPANPVVQASRELSPEDIRLLLQKGEQYVAAGDLVTARQVYRRAAEAGNAAAALAMGATFDPAVLARLGTFGMIADAAKAREWYEKAKSFGSPDAARRLESLAAR